MIRDVNAEFNLATRVKQELQCTPAPAYLVQAEPKREKERKKLTQRPQKR